MKTKHIQITDSEFISYFLNSTTAFQRLQRTEFKLFVFQQDDDFKPDSRSGTLSHLPNHIFHFTN